MSVSPPRADMLAHERPRRLQRVTQAILAFGVLSTGSGQSTLYESSGASRFRGICLRAMPQGSESFSIAISNSDGKRDFANPVELPISIEGSRGARVRSLSPQQQS